MRKETCLLLLERWAVRHWAKCRPGREPSEASRTSTLAGTGHQNAQQWPGGQARELPLPGLRFPLFFSFSFENVYKSSFEPNRPQGARSQILPTFLFFFVLNKCHIQNPKNYGFHVSLVTASRRRAWGRPSQETGDEKTQPGRCSDPP